MLTAIKLLEVLRSDVRVALSAGGGALLLTACGLALIAAHNAAITGSWTTFPYDLYRAQYGLTPAIITGRPVQASLMVPYININEYFKGESLFYNHSMQSIRNLILSVQFKFRGYLLFYVGPTLIVPFLAGFFVFFRNQRALLACFTLLCAGLAFEVWPHPHYAAVGYGYIVLIVSCGFQQLRKWTPNGRPLGVSLSRALIVAMLITQAYPLYLLVTGKDYGQSWRDMSNSVCCWLRTDDLHTDIETYLIESGATHAIVFIENSENGPNGSSIVYNHADIDNSRVIWVHDDPQYNLDLLSRFPGRTLLRVEWETDGSACLTKADSLTVNVRGAGASGPLSCVRTWRPVTPPGLDGPRHWRSE